MSRLWIISLVAGGLLAAGCGAEGSYRLTWAFEQVQEPPASGCGAHGVDAIRITGSNTEGDGEGVVALCSRGEIVRELPVGRWTLTVTQLDVRGADIDLQTLPEFAIEEDRVKDDLDVVILETRAQCDDDVDNDSDGRVDIADPECAGDPAGESEE